MHPDFEEQVASKVDPAHYRPTNAVDRTINLQDLQAIDVIEVFGLNYHLGTVAKYILRAGKKEELGYDPTVKAIEDLSKAQWYLAREVKRLKESVKNATC